MRSFNLPLTASRRLEKSSMKNFGNRKAPRKKKTRDQTRDLYEAEWETFPARPACEFSSLRSVQAFVNEVTSSKVWLFELNGPAVVIVRDNGDHEESYATSTGRIWVSRNMMDRETILHELAHIATGFKLPKHGRIFTGNLLALLRQFMGCHYASLLESAFVRRSVKY